MPMAVKTKCIYDPVERGDGYRVLVMRYWPRGVSKDKVDVWEKELGTPKELIKKWKAGSISWEKFTQAYLASIRSQEDKIMELAKRSKRQTITLLCSCRDADHCHRKLLKKVIWERK
jgi:uncharacterized protein YeaO (DUF488 family)